MKKVKKFLVPTLLVVVLMLTVVGSAPASDKQAPLAQGAHAIAVGASECIARFETCNYDNNGVRLTNDGGGCPYLCAVDFPEYGGHWVHTIYLYVYDFNNAGGQDICATAYRQDPQTGTEVNMGNVCSSGASTDTVRTFTLTGAALTNRWVLPRHKMYFYVNIPSPTNLDYYGVKVMYFM